MEKQKKDTDKYQLSVLLGNKNLRVENERDQVQRLYKMKKMQVFKMLNKKIKKGQPNLNLQMEYLLKNTRKKLLSDVLSLIKS